MAMVHVAALCMLAGIALGGPVLLNTGGPELPQISWRADTGVYASAGSTSFTDGGPNSATGSWAPVYESHRWVSSGNLEYKIPVPAGSFSMALMFAETWSGSGPGVRQMVIKINGAPVTQAGPGGLLDVFAKAGGLNKPVYLNVGAKTSENGFITVTCERVAGKNNPMISGIAIFGDNADELIGNPVGPTPSPKPAECASGNTGTVLKMNVGGGVISGLDYTAEDTSLIDGPQGSTYTASEPVMVDSGMDNAAIYLTERYTSAAALTYKIPVTEAGTYTVKTLHSESFLNAAGARVFNLDINGAVTNANVDIFGAVGKNKALILTNEVTMAAPGDITIKLVKVTSNPLVNGISVTGCTGTVVMPPTPTPKPTECTTGKIGAVLKMNVGGGVVSGLDYTADDTSLVTGPLGLTYTTTTPVEVDAGMNNADIYLTERYTTSTLTYNIPVSEAGTYTVQTLHSEGFLNAAGARVFNVEINGEVTNSNVDIFASVGKNKALILTNEIVMAAAGNIVIRFIKVTTNPLVNGITVTGCTTDVTPTPSPSPDPSQCPSGKSGTVLKMNAGGGAISHLSYTADDTSLINGPLGLAFTSTTPVTVPAGMKNAAVYLTERYTSATALTYNIPVAEAGTYTVQTMHSEGFLNAAGVRVFNVEINGAVTNENVDIFDAEGMNKALILTNTVTMKAAGDITIKFIKVKENPLVNGITITGCLGNTGKPSPTPEHEDVIDPVNHYAHPNSGGPYLATDYDKDGKATVALDASDSHSHATAGTTQTPIVFHKWTWTDASNPDAINGIVTLNKAKVSAVFPLGTTNVELYVEDAEGNNATEHTLATVVESTQPGAYCYKYDLGSSNPTTVTLPLDVKLNPKPKKADAVGDVNFGNTAAFDVPFAGNAFSVRCVYSIDLATPSTLSYSLLHSGPVKIYHNNVLQKSSNSASPNTVTNLPAKAYAAGLQNWQIHYLRKPAMQGKLVLQNGNGVVLPGSTVRHDASVTLPVITSLGKAVTAPAGGEVIGVFGTGFINQVSIFFGTTEATTVEVNAGTIQAIAPPGTGNVMITVKTAAGTSNGVPFSYNEADIPVLFSEDVIKSSPATKVDVTAPAVAIYGPDHRLYVGAYLGEKVTALALSKDFVVMEKCETTVEGPHSPRSVFGLAFNPKSNALKLHMATSTVDWNKVHKGETEKRIPNYGQGWTNGKIETITMSGPTGCFNNDRTDLITGLPVSNHDHGINSLQFLPTGELLIAIGGFTNGGIPSTGLGGIPSNPLEGAIVTCPATGTAMTYSNLNEPEKSEITGGACTTWATGLRNTYAMDYHTNRNMYATDNGANIKFGPFSTNCVGGSRPDADINDKLFKVEPGQCHGYANINRGECIQDDPKCVRPIISNLIRSTNGVLEYRSNTFQGKIKSNLFLTKFAAENDGRVYRVQLTPNGEVEKNGVNNFFFGRSGLTIVEGPRGELVMPRLRDSELLVLRPSYKAPKTTTLISVMPRRGPATGKTKVLITGHNFGSKPTATFDGVPCTNVVSVDSDTFTCLTPGGTEDSQVAVVVTGSAGTAISPGSDFWYF